MQKEFYTMNKKSFITIFCIFILSLLNSFVWAQVSCDPGDLFYTMAEGWEQRDVVDRLPQLRPYPLAVIKSILDEVDEKGTDADKSVAASFRESIFTKPWTVEFQTSDTFKLVYGENSTGNQLEVNPYIQGDASVFGDLITAGYKVGWFNTTKNPYDYIPLYQNFLHDSIQDAADIGPFDSYLDGNTAIAIGKKNWYMQAGVYRTGFGPYFNEGLALNDSAYHSANLSVHLDGSLWSYSEQLSVLGATTNTGDDLASNKYLSFHELSFYPNNTVALTYYETIVYGRRFDVSYLFPAPYMITQGINGCSDNLQMGIIFTYKPVAGFSWNTDLFVDDLSVNELVKLNIDSKNRIAAKTGIIYTPVNSLCSRMALDYTIITPYTYSHWEYDDSQSLTMNPYTLNYQNYTNNGICMGSSYPPNSDRLSFTMDLQPTQRFHVQITSAFMRHANVCESLTDDEAATYILSKKGTYASDGSVFSNSKFSGGKEIDTAWNHLNFLTQSYKMYIVQAGFSSEYYFEKMKGFELGLKLSYMFEYIQNKGVDVDIYKGYTVNDDGTFTWNGTTYATEAALETAVTSCVAQAKAQWISNLHTVLDNYISLGLVVRY